jgi:hypothetical protein
MLRDLIRTGHNSQMKKTNTCFCLIALFLTMPGIAAEAEDRHPLMTSKYWGNVGLYSAQRDFDISVNGSIAGNARTFDFSSSTGVDDRPDLCMAEFGWQFTPRWMVALQYFESERSGSNILSDTIEWQDLVFDVGVRVDAETSMEVTRLFFARRFRGEGPHSLRLGAGIHWLKLGMSIAGEATLNDLSREFRRSVVKTEIPMPNIGAWYRYSPSRKWMFNLRADWLSASVDKYNGSIWNASAGVNFSTWDHFGVGLSYQFLQLDGEVKEDRWRGEVQTSFTGPYVYINGYW